MKRIKLSLVISQILFVCYVLGMTFLAGVLFHDNDWVGAIAAAPLSLPEVVLYYFYPYELSYGFGLLFGFVANVILYAIPIYGVLTILERRRSRVVPYSDPPPPPTFDD